MILHFGQKRQPRRQGEVELDQHNERDTEVGVYQAQASAERIQCLRYDDSPFHRALLSWVILPAADRRAWRSASYRTAPARAAEYWPNKR